jgi:hypothetical protein
MLYRGIIAVRFADRNLDIFIDLNNGEFSGYNFLKPDSNLKLLKIE